MGVGVGVIVVVVEYCVGVRWLEEAVVVRRGAELLEEDPRGSEIIGFLSEAEVGEETAAASTDAAVLVPVLVLICALVLLLPNVARGLVPPGE